MNGDNIGSNTGEKMICIIAYIQDVTDDLGYYTYNYPGISSGMKSPVQQWP